MSNSHITNIQIIPRAPSGVKKYLLVFLLIFSVPVTSSELEVESWGYQLQAYNLLELNSSSFDLLVLDYSKDGSDEERFTTEELFDIQNTSKTVLSYISIGEAEDFRYYFHNDWFDNQPDFLGPENPNWPGNYKVKYWLDDWQDIIFGYLDRIVDAGFDGVYLDISDAFEFYETEFSEARQWMIDFVIDISEHVKLQKSGMLVFPQNGEDLLNDPQYRAAVDGIGREDVYVEPDRQRQRDGDEIAKIEDDLDLLSNEGKLVLVVDYTADTDLIDFARTSASDKGYVHYIGVQDLDILLNETELMMLQQSQQRLSLLEPILFMGGLGLVVGVVLLARRRFL